MLWLPALLLVKAQFCLHAAWFSRKWELRGQWATNNWKWSSNWLTQIKFLSNDYIWWLKDLMNTVYTMTKCVPNLLMTSVVLFSRHLVITLRRTCTQFVPCCYREAFSIPWGCDYKAPSPDLRNPSVLMEATTITSLMILSACLCPWPGYCCHIAEFGMFCYSLQLQMIISGCADMHNVYTHYLYKI